MTVAWVRLRGGGRGEGGGARLPAVLQLQGAVALRDSVCSLKRLVYVALSY